MLDLDRRHCGVDTLQYSITAVHDNIRHVLAKVALDCPVCSSKERVHVRNVSTAATAIFGQAHTAKLIFDILQSTKKGSCARLVELHDSTSRGAFAVSCDLNVGTPVQGAVELQLTGTRLPRACLLLLLDLLRLFPETLHAMSLHHRDACNSVL